MSNVSILMHQLGAAPDYGGSFLTQNRIIGQVNSSEVVECAPSRCAGTGRPSPCYCTKGAESGGAEGSYTLNAVSNQVHTIWRTPSYLLGGVVFSPNDFFSANTQQRWVGLIFSNAYHTAVGMPHITGEKWSLIDADIGIFHKCGSCNYGGDSIVDLFNATASVLPAGCSRADADQCQQNRCMHCGCVSGKPPCPPAHTGGIIWQQDGWTFVGVVDIAGEAAWAAVRSAWGGDVLLGGVDSMTLTPNDTWAPIVILAGRAAEYGTASNFTAMVTGAGLAVKPTGSSHGEADVTLDWHGKHYAFHAQNTTQHYRLPEVDGTAVDIAPRFQYSGPHLKAELGAEVVRTVFPGYALDYHFKDDEDHIVKKKKKRRKKEEAEAHFADVDRHPL